ncbi:MULTISPECIES: vWA domain-containing protein [Actinomyces]|uniref:VWA domain-containing protein n=1 Tax=Actinomyces respiraculi TaxID=2744574 RepID=A0A7T0LL88_9ACTO|nr:MULTISPECIES: VWA domain-containing protein [Actinomyces]QPL05208.1 VWA domain-containing protein [Actinomyces respiraculi]
MVMPWLTAALVLVAAVLVVLAATGLLTGRSGRLSDALKRLRRTSPSDPAPMRLGNAAALLASPHVRSSIAHRRVVLAGLALLAVGAFSASATLAGRPVAVTERSDTLSNRDIVLCLDTSTSMLTTDARILQTFSDLLDSFDGERVALVAWNSTAQTMVPLTDDYDLLRSEMHEIAEALDFVPSYGNPALYDYYDTFIGTFGDVEASSLIGDGLASCALAFDREVEDRSRTVILASDNQVLDPYDLQIYNLAEAADLATERGVRLISVYGADPELLDPYLAADDITRARAELQTVTTEHGGLFYESDDADAAAGIVRELEADQIEEVQGDVVTVVSDEPVAPAARLMVCVVVLLGLAAWRRV